MKIIKNIFFLLLVSIFIVPATINIASDMIKLYLIGLFIFIAPVSGFLIGKSNGFLESTSLALTVVCIFYFDYHFPFDRIYNWLPMVAMMVMLFVDILSGFGVKVAPASQDYVSGGDTGYPNKYLVKGSDINPATNSMFGTGLNGMHNMLNRHD